MTGTFQVCEWKKTYENKLNANNWIITAKNFPCLKQNILFYHSKVYLDSRRSQTTMMANQQVQVITANTECVLKVKRQLNTEKHVANQEGCLKIEEGLMPFLGG